MDRKKQNNMKYLNVYQEYTKKWELMFNEKMQHIIEIVETIQDEYFNNDSSSETINIVSNSLIKIICDLEKFTNNEYALFLDSQLKEIEKLISKLNSIL
jgi:hypothetical protein